MVQSGSGHDLIEEYMYKFVIPFRQLVTLTRFEALDGESLDIHGGRSRGHQ